jgi:hypothetical protein
MVHAMDPAPQQHLLERCNVTTVEQMDWYGRCNEADSSGKILTYERIAYAWQAEFRSLQIWTHPALAAYKTMMWLDTDGFCAKQGLGSRSYRLCDSKQVGYLL